MISRITFCSAQPVRIRSARLGPMPAISWRRSGACSMVSNTVVAERLDQLFGVDRADALDHAGAEIALDAFQRGRRGGPEEGGLELQPVGAVVHPDARGLDELAGADAGGGADHRHQVALAARLDPQHAKAVLGVVEGHPLHQAAEGLALGWRGRAHPGPVTTKVCVLVISRAGGNPDGVRRVVRNILKRCDVLAEHVDGERQPLGVHFEQQIVGCHFRLLKALAHLPDCSHCSTDVQVHRVSNELVRRLHF